MRAVAAAKALVWDGLARWSFPLAADGVWRASAPVDELAGADEVEHRLRTPLLRAFDGMTFQPYLFFGGVNGVDGVDGAGGTGGTGGVGGVGGVGGSEIWIGASGNIVGEFRASLFGVPPSGGAAKLRTGAFWRVDNGRVAEGFVLFDLLGLAAQAGLRLLPPFAGAEGPPPGPAANNGLRRDASPAASTAKTLALVEAMLGGCNRLRDGRLESMGMADFWHPDMAWHGPWGIGTCRGFDSFQRDAQGPSVASFPDRRGGFHRCRFADGEAAGFAGWPSLRGTFNGAPFRGIAPTGGVIGQRIMDFYIRRGGLLAENWVLIDLVDFARQCGADLLPLAPSAGRGQEDD